LMALCVSSVGGFWITACKGHMRVEDIFPIVIEVDGVILVMIDFISHHLPLFFHYKNRKAISDTSLSSGCIIHLVILSPLVCHVLLCAYLLLNSVEKRYGAPSQIVIGGWIISTFMFLYLKCNTGQH
jgi:glycerol-3-phosphate acyltransferase PlsY